MDVDRFIRFISVYIGRINIKESETEVITMLKEKKLEFRSLMPIKNAHNKFKSYKFEIPYSQRNSIFNPEKWEQGLVVNKYYEKRIKPKTFEENSSITPKTNLYNHVFNPMNQNNLGNKDSIFSKNGNFNELNQSQSVFNNKADMETNQRRDDENEFHTN
jgi:hypothetical protein